MPDDAYLLREARILVVSNERADVRQLPGILEAAGYQQITTAEGAGETLAAFEQFSPDLVLLPFQLPESNGIEVTGELRRRIAEEDFLPVVLVTQDNSRQLYQQCLEAGVNDFLTAPFDRSEVLLRVRNLLRMRFVYTRCQREMQSLDERVRERTRDVVQAQMEIIDRLGAAAESRDSDTGCHVGRVGAMAASLAESLGVPQPEISLIRRAAPLHDIGKIAIPDSILLKPGRLTSEEFELMKQHTVIGARILSGSRFPILKTAEEIALTHHENWDGTGYPNHLGSTEIPLGGRIVAIADVFDALTHERSYKRAWTVEEALAEIRSLSGTKFDPSVVEAFLSIMHDEIKVNG